MNAKSKHTTREGAILPVIMVVMIIFSIVVLSLYSLANHSSREAVYQEHRTQAFWLAEAGVGHCIADLYAGGDGNVSGTLSTGSYEVERIERSSSESYAIVVGRVGAGDGAAEQRVRVDLLYIPETYKKAIAALSQRTPMQPWSLHLSGSGDPINSNGTGSPLNSGSYYWGHHYGGPDLVYGDVYVNGSVDMFDESYIHSEGDFSGDLDATDNYYFHGDYADAADGSENGFASTPTTPDLLGMNYVSNNDYNVTAIFDEKGTTSGGYLNDPSHHLYNVFRKVGDTYYFDGGPRSDSTGGALGTMNIDVDGVYYVDGDVKFEDNDYHRISLDGTATIVATGDIYLYEDFHYRGGTAGDDLLAIIAMGENYDSDGLPRQGGNIYFGDDRYQYMGEMNAFMFAANNFEFYFGSDDNPVQPKEGFKVVGNYVAGNQVIIYRDWYQSTGGWRPAVRVLTQDVDGYWIWGWQDAIDPITYTETPEDDDIRHYQMIVEYDPRILDPESQPPGLPRSKNGLGIFGGIKRWQYYN